MAQVNALFDELKTQINEIETQLAALRKDTKLAPDARADKLTALNEKCNAAKKVRSERTSECSFALGDSQSILRESASPSSPGVAQTHRSLKLELRELPKDKAKAIEPVTPHIHWVDSAPHDRCRSDRYVAAIEGIRRQNCKAQHRGPPG